MDELIALPNVQRQQSILYAFQHYGKRLFNFIRSCVQNDEDAEEPRGEFDYDLPRAGTLKAAGDLDFFRPKLIEQIGIVVRYRRFEDGLRPGLAFERALDLGLV